MPSRRRLLAGLGAALATCAGCSALGGRRRTRIGEVVLLNMDDSPHTVRLQIGSRGETLFRTRRAVPPADERQPVVTPADGLPTEPRRYTVTAELDDGVDTVQRTYPSGGGDCYSVTVRVGRDGRFRDVPVEPAFEGCR